MSIFERSLEKGAGVLLHASSLATEKPLSMEAARIEAKNILFPVAETSDNRPTSREYTINDFDRDVRVIKADHPSVTHEVEATDRLVDEMIFDSADSYEAMQRAAKIGAELLAISYEHATQR